MYRTVQLRKVRWQYSNNNGIHVINPVSPPFFASSDTIGLSIDRKCKGKLLSSFSSLFCAARRAEQIGCGRQRRKEAFFILPAVEAQTAARRRRRSLLLALAPSPALWVKVTTSITTIACRSYRLAIIPISDIL